MQRILASDEEVTTVSEGWFLLPLVYTLRATGVSGDYKPQFAHQAIEDIIAQLPRGIVDYRDAIRAFAYTIYSRLGSNGPRYFVDKTPLYSLIAKDVVDIFPEAKFIFLWRNPLAIAASIIETAGHGRFNLWQFQSELYTGMANVVDVWSRNSSTTLALRYEDLCTSPQETMDRLCVYLDLDGRKHHLDGLAESVVIGRLGDPSPRRTSSDVTPDRISQWREVMCNPFRRWWCLRYLDWIGADRLEAMGYDIVGLAAELRGIPMTKRYFLSDIARFGYGEARTWFGEVTPKRVPNWIRRL